jgi:hypothetical protein
MSGLLCIYKINRPSQFASGDLVSLQKFSTSRASPNEMSIVIIIIIVVIIGEDVVI